MSAGPPDPYVALLPSGLRLVRRLGRGGTAVVLLVEDRAGRRSALKVLDALSERAHARARREAAALVEVRHPNVVEVHGTRSVADRLALHLEYVPGPTLRDVLQRVGPLPQEAVDRVVADVVAGLGALHRRGLVHRDVKPSNLMVDPRPPTGPAVRIADFGCLKAAASDGAGTLTHELLGTPAYMPPEQFDDAASVDLRADVFALGATAYELLTGRRCFDGSVGQVVRDTREGRWPRLDEAVVPPRVVAAIGRALEPVRERRWASVAAFADAFLAGAAPPDPDVLRPLVRGLPIEDPPAPRRPGRRVVAAALASGVAGAAALGALWMLGSPCPRGMALLPTGGGVDGFCLDRAEVTTAAWLACVERGACPAVQRVAVNDVYLQADPRFLVVTAAQRCTRPDQGDHPVNCVTWEQAVAFCGADGRRLPTDEEWQWAFHGGPARTALPWGEHAVDDAVLCLGRTEIEGPMRETCPVRGRGAPDASPQGVTGLVGNVWEWTATSRKSLGGRSAHAYRGGGFPGNHLGLWPEVPEKREAGIHAADDMADPALGFRCAADLP